MTRVKRCLSEDRGIGLYQIHDEGRTRSAIRKSSGIERVYIRELRKFTFRIVGKTPRKLLRRRVSHSLATGKSGAKRSLILG